MFATLEDARKALQFLHSVDGAHRDVGAGDVLRSGKIGKLADLEYAKRVDSNTTHEVRTGTLDFMACEVETQKYLFKPAKADPSAKAASACLGSILYTTWSLSGGLQHERGAYSSLP